MNRTPLLRASLILIVPLLLGILALPPSALGEGETPPYVPDEIIIKFKPLVGEKAKGLFDLKIPFATVTGTGTLDLLNARFGVQKMERVFQFLEAMGALQGKEFLSTQELLLEVKQKFPQRSSRAAGEIIGGDLENIYLVQFNEGVDPLEAIRAYEKDPNVVYAQPNYFVETYWVPNDYYYNHAGAWGQPPGREDYEDLWALKNKKIALEAAWDVTKGEGIIVAVVDSGLDYTHPDIQGNVWINAAEDLNANGVVDGTWSPCPHAPSGDFNCEDNDGNGYIDDVRGWDFTALDLNGDGDYNDTGDKPPDADPMDGFRHGTHVSGTIAAVGDNGIGIIGVAPKAKIMPVKAINDNGGARTTDLVNGILYAARKGADVINNSWGCPSPCPSSPIKEEAVRVAYGVGAVVVFSAGNSRADVVSYSPQNMVSPKPIVVSATDHTDEPWFWTNWGTTIDVAAPGVGGDVAPPDYEPFRNILSLRAKDTGNPLLVVDDYYLRSAGTSMSAPHVSGLVALILAHHSNDPSFTNEDVRQLLRASAEDVSTPGFDLWTGTGRINATRALSINEVLRVRIEAPFFGAILSQGVAEVGITGTAFGATLKQYELFYGLGSFPPEWFPIGEPVTTPVEEGILTTWKIQDLLSGLYSLKLVATSLEGFQFQDVVQVRLERSSPGPISPHLANQTAPTIWEDKIVWEDYRNGNPDIYLYDLTQDTETRLTFNTGTQWNPVIWEDKIFWEDYRNGDWDICSGDPCANWPADQLSPAIWGDWLVWQDNYNGNWDIRLYDFYRGVETEITTSTKAQQSPKIWENRIVWEDYQNGNWDIYSCVYNGVTCPEEQITTDPVDQRYPKISGDKIVWVESHNKAWDIYFYNLTNKTKQRIASELFPLPSTAISEDKIVWEEDRDIYLYDILTSKERAIATGPWTQRSPAISGNRIVWEELHDNQWDIYYRLYYLCGDADGTRKINLTDIIYLVNYLFKGGPKPYPLESGDASGDGKINLTDIIYLVNYLFKGGPAPVCP